MIDLSTADNALKQVYLNVIQNQLNNKADPVLARIKKTTKDVWGDKIITNYYYKDEYCQVEEKLSTLTATIEISDRAIRCSQNSAGAFVNLINDEIENMLNDTTRRLINSFYTEDTKPDYLSENYKYEPMKVSGLKKLFDTKNDNPILNPHIKKIDKFDPVRIQEIIDGNGEINMMICSPKIRREYMEYCSNTYRCTEIKELDGGYKCIEFNGLIPIHTNKNIPDNEIYLINIEDFKLHQLCDWEWLEDENGRILKQDTTRPVYRATLVKYANYICSNPSGQIKIIIDGGKI